MTHLVLIRGIPGSGKSTMAQKLLHDNLVDVHIEADMYYVVDGVYEWNAENIHNAHMWCQDQTDMELSRVNELLFLTPLPRYGNNTIFSNC